MMIAERKQCQPQCYEDFFSLTFTVEKVEQVVPVQVCGVERQSVGDNDGCIPAKEKDNGLG